MSHDAPSYQFATSHGNTLEFFHKLLLNKWQLKCEIKKLPQNFYNFCWIWMSHNISLVANRVQKFEAQYFKNLKYCKIY